MAGTVAVYCLGAGVATFVAAKQVRHKLTQFIANSISSIFEVDDDPNSIRTSLSTSGKLVLNNVRVKPQMISDNIRLEGDVDNLTFTWHWGRSILKDAELTVSGARIRIILIEESSSGRYRNQAPLSTPSSMVAEQQQQAGENTDSGDDDVTLQNILDQLSLIIEDITFTIEVETKNGQSESTAAAPMDNKNNSAVIEGKSLQLIPLGRTRDKDDKDNNNPLLQELVIRSFGIYVPGGNIKNDNFWIMEPFGYKATIQKVGKRFEDLETGLVIIGEVISKDDRKEPLTIHAGETQIRTLLHIMKTMMMPTPSDEDNRNGQSAAAAATTTTPENDDEKAVANHDLDKSSSLMITLPIPSVKLVLPGGGGPSAYIQTHHWQISYRFDGSICKLEGTGPGVYLKDGFRFIALEKNARCVIDLTESKIIFETINKVKKKKKKDAPERTEEDGSGAIEVFLEADTEEEEEEEVSSGESPVIVQVDWKEVETKPMIRGIRRALDLFYPPPPTVESESAAITSTEERDTTTSSVSAAATPWSLFVDGKIAYWFEGQGPPQSLPPDAAEDQETTKASTQWIEATVDSPELVMANRSDEIPNLLTIQGLDIGPSSFGDFSLHFSTVRMQSKSVHEKVVDDLHRFLFRVIGMDTWLVHQEDNSP